MDIVYAEYLSKFRDMREAFEAEDRLALHQELERAARQRPLTKIISEVAVWDAARSNAPRSRRELFVTIMQNPISRAAVGQY